MEQAAIIEKLTGIFRTTFHDDTIVVRGDLTANDVAAWDSLTHMLMIAEVENEFFIKFKLNELGKLEDVKSLIELIQVKIADSNSK